MRRHLWYPRLTVLAVLLLSAVACGGGTPAGTDVVGTDVVGTRPDSGSRDAVGELAMPDDGPDAATRPTCCTDALCAALAATCDPTSCRCVPARACCDAATCGAAGMVCDPESCRCARVPCDVEGAPCRADLFAGNVLPVVCTATTAGRFCLARSPGYGACAGGFCSVWDETGCTCGWSGCLPFGDDCDAGTVCIPYGDDCDADVVCIPSDDTQRASGSCGVPGTAREGERCTVSGDCAAGFLCDVVCVPIECGSGPGAPACPPGRACRPLDAWGVVGACRVPCDPFDPDGPCAADEWCRAPCAYQEFAPWCGTSAAPVYGRVGGWCTRRVDGSAPPGRGAPCASEACAPGYLCAGGRCLEACPPGPPGTANGAAVCARGLECAPAAIGWPVTANGGVCASPCDPFAAVPDADCDGSDVCTLSGVATPALGHCLARPYETAGPGEWCYPEGMPCRSGLVCATVGPRRDLRCVPACRVDAAPGRPGACADGERCFRAFDTTWQGWAPWGYCAVPCDPWAADAGCPPSTTCEPRDRDPATGRLVGVCLNRDTGAEGQPCMSSSANGFPGCAPGLACLPDSGGQHCRRRCDVRSSHTGDGSCAPGETCRRGWPPVDDPVVAGCVAD